MVLLAGAPVYEPAKEREGAPSFLPRCSCPFSLIFPSFFVSVLSSDSGIIGTREFVKKNYQRFNHIFHSKNEKIPKRISGLNGVYSLKRLTE